MTNKSEKKIKENAKAKEDTAAPKELDIHYIKSNCYRTFHVDGIFGGVTPVGKIHVATFVERQVLPETVRQKVEPDGKLGLEISRVTKQGITREIEAGLVMDVDMAKTFRNWLDIKIKEFEKVAEVQKIKNRKV